MRLNIEYEINESLLYILVELGHHTKQEVWSNLQDVTQKCFKRLKESGKTITWTTAEYPGTSAKLRIDILRDNPLGLCEDELAMIDRIKGKVKIKLHNKSTKFSSKQVEEFLVDKILLGAE